MWRRTRSVRLRSSPNWSPALRAPVCSNRLTASDLAVFEAGGMWTEMSRHALWKHASSLPSRCHLAVGEDARQTILGVDLLVEDRPHLAVVPDVRLAVAGVGVGEEAAEGPAVEQPVGAVQPVVILGEQEERAVVRRLDDHVRAVLERQPVHAVGRHHRRQLADVDDRPRVAVVAPGRGHDCAMPGVGRVHAPSLPRIRLRRWRCIGRRCGSRWRTRFLTSRRSRTAT